MFLKQHDNPYPYNKIYTAVAVPRYGVFHVGDQTVKFDKCCLPHQRRFSTVPHKFDVIIYVASRSHLVLKPAIVFSYRDDEK